MKYLLTFAYVCAANTSNLNDFPGLPFQETEPVRYTLLSIHTINGENSDQQRPYSSIQDPTYSGISFTFPLSKLWV